jgi:hypothetical protein
MIRAKLATLPRAEKAALRYEGSNRYYRGRALAALREAPGEGMTLRELGESLRERFGEEDLPWLLGVVGSLEKDGLVRMSSAEGRSEVLAEGQAAYGSDRSEDPLGATTHVSLL